MRDILDICQQATEAPKLGEQDFDLDNVYATIVAMTGKYDIKFDGDNPVPADDALADRVFAAATEFMAACGVYFKDEQRVVKFSADEVTSAIADYDGDCHFGEGADARVFRSRKPDSDSRPWCHVGAGTVASTEEIAMAIVRGNASIAAADSMSVPALDHVDGHLISAGSPAEVRGAIRSIQIAREACKQAGREGLAIINGVAAAGTHTGTIAASSQAASWRESDCVIVGTLAEFKTNMAMMTKVVWSKESHTNIVLASAPIMGGYGGGAEGLAILNAAYPLLGMLLYGCDYYLSLPMDLRLSCSTTREIIWASSVSSQAIARNTNMPALALPYAAGGPMTSSYYYEAAAATIAAVASGVSFQTTHPARALFPDHLTPMEMRTATEIGLGAAGLTRAEASGIVSKLLAHYEPHLADAPRGKTYSECFDLATGEPTADHAEFVARVKVELAAFGVPFTPAER